MLRGKATCGCDVCPSHEAIIIGDCIYCKGRFCFIQKWKFLAVVYTARSSLFASSIDYGTNYVAMSLGLHEIEDLKPYGLISNGNLWPSDQKVFVNKKGETPISY